MSLKLDGFGFRFGNDNNEFFVESSRSGIIKKFDTFSSYTLKTLKGNRYDNLRVERAKQYDELHKILHKSFHSILPKNCKIICEVLLNSLAVDFYDQYKFVSVLYDKEKLGKCLTIGLIDTIGINKDDVLDLSSNDIKIIDCEIPDVDIISIPKCKHELYQVLIGITPSILGNDNEGVVITTNIGKLKVIYKN